LNHINQHYAQPLNLEQLADVACLSPYHWHRIFMSLTGETIHQCLRRTRLNKACQLLKSGVRVERIAKKVGFQHPDSLAKAFKTSYRLTPKQFQNQAMTNPHKPSFLSNTLDCSMNLTKTTTRQTCLETLGPLTVLSVLTQGPYSLISEKLNQLLAFAFSRNLFNDSVKFYTIYYNDAQIRHDGLHLWRACITYPKDLSIEAPFEHQTIPGGLFLTTVHHGPYETIESTMQALYHTLLNHPNVVVAPRPQFESYLNNPRVVHAKDLQTKIFIPVARI
jgi:AraC family transcriptional regulator